MGGALALLAASQTEDILCAAPFYGVPPGLDCGALSKPVLAQFGSVDNHAGFSDPAAAARLAEALKSGAGAAESEVVVHDGVGHGFMNASPKPFGSWEERGAAMGPGVTPYNPAVAEAAWDKLLAFLGKHLGTAAAAQS